MNIAFALDPYPSGSAIDYLANEINAEVESTIIIIITNIITNITIIIIISIFTGEVDHQLVPQSSNEAQTDPRCTRYDIL